MIDAKANSYDFAVIGGGIVGLATAQELSKRYSDARILLLEKESAVGQHQSGRNSGVLHSGIYYKPGSLKATTTRANSPCEEYKAKFKSPCPVQVGNPVAGPGRALVGAEKHVLA